MAYRSVERWVEFGLCCVIILARVLARIYDVGFRSLKAHDYAAVVTFFFYVISNITQEFVDEATARLMAMSTSPDQNPEKTLAEVETALKWGFAALVLYIVFFYVAKVCLLLYYSTFSQLWQNRHIFILAAVSCALSFLITMGVVIGFHSRFVSDEHGDPYSGTYGLAYGILSVFICHVFSDILLVAIPYPIIKTLWGAKIPYGRKLLLGAMVCSGIFTVSCATIVFIQFTCKVGTFAQQTEWPKREQFVWMIVLNLPSILSMFRGKIWSNTERDGGTLRSLQTEDVPQESVSKA